MKTNHRKVPAQFAPDTRCEVAPSPAAVFRGELESQFERLQDRLLRQSLEEKPRPEFNALLRRAAREAAGLAWLTPYPLLVFPGLFEEKVQVAVVQCLRQNRICQPKAEWLAAAA